MAHEHVHGSSNRRPRETLGPGNPNISNLPMPPSAVKRSSSATGFYQPSSIVGSHARSGSNSRMSLAAARPSQPNFVHASPMVTNPSIMMDVGGGTSLGGVMRGPRNQYSLAPGTQLGGGLVVGGSAGGGLYSGASHRKSLMPMSSLPLSTPARSGSTSHSDLTARRASVLPRAGQQSMIGPNQSGPSSAAPVSFFATTQPAPVTVESRPFRSQQARSAVVHELINYLSEKNFEMDMDMPVPSYKSMTTCPSGREVAALLRWMYKQVDPSYVFPTNLPFDAVYLTLLKNIRCPYEKALTRSQFAAPQTTNWPTFLAVLQWLMHLAQMMNAFASGRYDHACAEAGFDVTSDRISFEFLAGGYRDWMTTDEDEDDPNGAKLMERHVELMAQRFDEANSEHFEYLNKLEEENKQAREQIAKLKDSEAYLERLKQTVRVLEEDRGKFEQYIEGMHPRIERCNYRINLLTEQIESKDGEIASLESELREIQAAVDASGLTVADMDRMTSERKQLQNKVESMQARLEEVQRRVSEAERSAQAKLYELESEVARYNTQGYHLELIPTEAKNSWGMDLELKLTLYTKPQGEDGEDGDDDDNLDDLDHNAGTDQLVGWSGTGHQRHTITNIDVKQMLWSQLNEVRQKTADRRGEAQDADMKTQDLLRKVHEELREKKSEVEALEHRARTAESEYSKSLEVTTQQSTASTAQIEKMEQEFSQLQQDLDASVEIAQQRELAATLAHERVSLAVRQVRDEFHTDVARMLDDVVAFKLHIQRSLEDYETFVAEVTEAEWALGNDDDDDDEQEEAGMVDDVEGVRGRGGGTLESEADGEHYDDEETALAASTQRQLRIRGGS